MRRTLLLLLALTFLLPASADAARRQVPHGWLGVVIDGPLLDPAFAGSPEWDNLAGSGAESIRAAFYWHQIQPTGPADANFSATDAIVLSAAQRGLDVLPVVHLTPSWAARNADDPASPPRDNADFARVLRMLVTRYGPIGSFWAEHPEVPKQPIRAWQIWNEPNLTRYWNVSPWARTYVKLLKAADRALKKADRGSQTVLAGLPNESWKAMEALYDAGARRAFDVATLHPYTGKPENVVRIVKIVRRVMQRHRDGKVPVWVTELSFPAAEGKTPQHGGFETTEAGQKRRLAKALPLLAEQRKRLRIDRVYWYTWLSAEASTGSAFDYSGLRRLRDGQLHDAPSLATFRRLARRLQGCKKRAGDARRCA
ncbi:MAG TPA: cellulase family glycosylhydrolase [Solirubrobacter sp.]|nr:cellulase family glycosylhydrolase [Solirubrobacter sp.]